MVGFNPQGSQQTLGKLTSLTIDKEARAWVCSELGEDSLLGENNSVDNSHRRPWTSEDTTPKDHYGTEVC